MNRETTIEQLKAIIKPYIQNQEAFDNITMHTDFINDLKINSANLVDIVLDIEEEYDLVIDNQSMQQMLDIKSAVEIIENKLAEK